MIPRTAAVGFDTRDLKPEVLLNRGACEVTVDGRIGVKYSRGAFFEGAPRHVMVTCTDAVSVRAADSGVARCDRVVAAVKLQKWG